MSTLYDHEEIEIQSLEIDVPAWIEQDITCGTVAAILQGGCASGAYMPACWYSEANETMAKHGDDVLDYLEGCGMLEEITLDGQSWSGLACSLLSMAVELWASSIEDEAEDILEEIEGRLVEWSLSDDGTIDTVVEVTCRWCGESHELRYDCDYAAEWRDESGALDCEAFQDDVIYTDDIMCPHCGEFA